MLSFRLKRFLTFFVPLVLITTAISLNLYFATIEADQARLQSKHASLLTYQKDGIEKTLNLFMSDLMVLSSQHELKLLFASDGETHRHDLANEIVAFMEHKDIYDQARILDLDGNEIFRVNSNSGAPVVIQASKLQNKSERYYFKEIVALGEGEFYISPFDLNIEHGAIQQPLNPVIRMATPIFDERGNKRAIIILNMVGEGLLSPFEKLVSAGVGKTLLINAEGYWLKGLQREDEWGFMFSEGRDRTFQKRFPEAAKIVMSSENGTLSLDSGFFAYTRISAAPTLEGHSINPSATSNWWWIISYVSPQELDLMSQVQRERYILFNVIFALLFAIGSWIGADAMNRHHLAEKQLMVSERRFRSVTETAKDAIIITDGDGEIVSWNGGATYTFGYTESETLGEQVTMIMPERYREMHNQGIQHYKENGYPVLIDKTMELHGLKKDGEEIDIRFSLSTWGSDGEHYYGAIIHDITETKKLERQLEAMASKDGLTGLYNRITFDTRIIEELSRAKRYKHPISLMFLDIDYFKKVNDHYGHAAGDACLIEFAELMRKMTRTVDVVARYGGEEFVIILPHTDSKSATILAERLREAAEQMSTIYKNEHISWTISIGLASLEQSWDISIESWLERADGALYKAKDSGRNQVVISPEEHV
ncbi:diguanylate cyclase [Mariprofundus sp. NF]|uniref:diguanylate cyclase n=1 Tax=Mariprofundus sp. NF TaxID=2608716 RepID=UPI0015A1D81D|nr:diguanylate cyclase [Mariprofundus sp. NF]NWF39346.1 diguanylate cyclase [Mariprofundus sp. NF]